MPSIPCIKTMASCVFECLVLLFVSFSLFHHFFVLVIVVGDEVRLYGSFSFCLFVCLFVGWLGELDGLGVMGK